MYMCQASRNSILNTIHQPTERILSITMCSCTLFVFLMVASCAWHDGPIIVCYYELLFSSYYRMERYSYIHCSMYIYSTHFDSCQIYLTLQNKPLRWATREHRHDYQWKAVGCSTSLPCSNSSESSVTSNYSCIRSVPWDAALRRKHYPRLLLLWSSTRVNSVRLDTILSIVSRTDSGCHALGTAVAPAQLQHI